MNRFMSAEYEAVEYFRYKGVRMNFRISAVAGSRRLWVAMFDENNCVVDALPCMRLVWGLERRIERKMRKLLRMHEKLVSLGFRK